MITKTLDEFNALLQKDGKTISKRQLIIALLWMLRSELARDPGQENKALLKNRMCLMELNILDHSKDIVPENFFGNAYLGPMIAYKDRPNAFPDDDLKHVLLNACLSVSEFCDGISRPDRLAEILMMSYQLVNNQLHFSAFLFKTYSCCWSTVSTDEKMCDFGRGPPSFAFTCPSFPFFYYSSAMCPAIGHDGVFVSFFLVARHKDTFLNSQVLKDCAPGARVVFQQNSPHMEAMKLW